MSTTEFNSLVMTHAEDLQPIAYRFTQDRESAKDLSQETIYRALANREKYTTGTNIRAWLFTIMRNTFINNYRRRAKQRTIFEDQHKEYVLESTNTLISNEVEGSLQLKEIQQAIYGLPQIFKTPFLLYFAGYRYHEIAASLNEPLGTIKSRIFFARKLLKDQINLN